jgi:hypothetical protein
MIYIYTIVVLSDICLVFLLEHHNSTTSIALSLRKQVIEDVKMAGNSWFQMSNLKYYIKKHAHLEHNTGQQNKVLNIIAGDDMCKFSKLKICS